MAAAVTEINSHEEILRQRIRDNLKHFEKLGISRELLEFAQREYNLLGNDAKLRFSCKRKNSSNQSDTRLYTGRIASEDQKIDAVKKAEEFQRNLKALHPSFTKPMLRSHVSGGFWLGLPKNFCDDNLPLCELRMILEDEKGVEYDSLYLGRKNGLSGGWRGFAIAHNLEDGDVLVFELIAPARFKVYIMKAIDEEITETNNKEDVNGITSSAKRKKIIIEKENVPPISPSGKTKLKAGSTKKAEMPKKH